jgi:hypothetical protein
MLSLSGQLQYIDLLVTNENIKNNKPSSECYDFAIKEKGGKKTTDTLWHRVKNISFTNQFGKKVKVLC